MTNEEMQKTMEFILGQQAQFAVNIQRLQEQQLRETPRLTRLEDSFQLLVQLAENTDSRLVDLESRSARLEINAEAFAEGLKDVNAKINVLVDSQIRTDEHLRRTDEQLRVTDEHLRRTDENVRRTDDSLRNLIEVVDRYLSQGRNGR